MERAMQERTRAYVERPDTGSELPPAEEYRAFEFDPSITLNQDLADQSGPRLCPGRDGRQSARLFRLRQTHIVVIDGDAEDQVRFALAEGDELDTLIVIAKGSPLALGRAHGRRFWFDQDAVMVSRFGLERLPSVIKRADPILLIEEIPTGEAQP
ncbi:hypothetical protein [Cereibacter sphaeroides]|uniref:hypothetical protein n=1 Tax=Cereibacter sphaeroides TaxID=1063 RepID=UPI002156614B|nr:hypothetical protein [Cereibacter sphaeroides]